MAQDRRAIARGLRVKGHLGIVGAAQIVQGGEDAAVDDAAAMRRDGLLHRRAGPRPRIRPATPATTPAPATPRLPVSAKSPPGANDRYARRQHHHNWLSRGSWDGHRGPP